MAKRRKSRKRLKPATDDMVAVLFHELKRLRALEARAEVALDDLRRARLQMEETIRKLKEKGGA